MTADLGMELHAGTLITSKTNLKSLITYCNHDFYVYSGFSEGEVLGKPHNIVRHKDMPKAVFKLLWDYIQEGREVFAFVKNRTKDNRHYWVFANVTPSIDTSNNIVGYYSVRRRPNPAAIAKIAPLYAQMLQAEKSGGIEASSALLAQVCEQAGVEYNEFIFALQKGEQ